MARLTVAICGAGQLGHLLAVRFAARGVRVHLLTGSSALVRDWATNPAPWQVKDNAGQILAQARPDLVTTRPDAALSKADMVLLTAPAHARPKILAGIAPHLARDREVYLGAVPGGAGFDWQAETALAGRPDVVIWGFKDVPQIAHDLDPGCSVREGGNKAHLHIATHRRTDTDSAHRLLEKITDLFDAPVSLLGDYLEITLTPGNALMHPPVLFALCGPDGLCPDGQLATPREWWADITPDAARLIEASDADNQTIRNAASRRLNVDLGSVAPLYDELVAAYGAQIGDPTDMFSLLRTNRAYSGIQIPTRPLAGGRGVAIDRDARAFHEDVAVGLAVLIGIAQKLAVPVPTLERIHGWAVNWHGELPDLAGTLIPHNWPEAA